MTEKRTHLDKTAATDLALQLMAAHHAREADARFEQALDLTYWAQLIPELSVDGTDAAKVVETSALSPEKLENYVSEFRAAGVLRTDPIIPPEMTRRLWEGIETLQSAGWPSVFSFLYDAYWKIARVDAVKQILTALLGPNYRQTPYFWTHVVSRTPGARGWGPHVDCIDRKRRRLTLWFALTDSSLDNGCMYAIPRDCAPQPLKWGEHANFSQGDVKALLQACKAMPAPAGSVLGWDDDILHWGGIARGNASPRVALSMEFLRGGIEPYPTEQPLLDGDGPLLTHRQRLRAIAIALRSYSGFEPASGPALGLADRLLSLKEA